MPEEQVLMRSLRDSNVRALCAMGGRAVSTAALLQFRVLFLLLQMPKFVFDDVPLFRGLIADLFPGLDLPRVAYPQLKAAIEAEFEKQDMRHDDEPTFQLQVDKPIQLYEIMLTRHTTMIVGPTGGGKTVCLQMLQKASGTAFDMSVKTFTVNPKAQTVNELYGVMDPVTRDWTDGILSKLFRQCNDQLPPGRENEVRWIVFDGDVDALWVENMNVRGDPLPLLPLALPTSALAFFPLLQSVMDDNKLLTLPNGERIRLQSHCKLLIEVFDLQYASPATISRCGQAYVDPKNLGFRPFYVRWLKQRGAKGGTALPRTTECANLMVRIRLVALLCVCSWFLRAWACSPCCNCRSSTTSTSPSSSLTSWKATWAAGARTAQSRSRSPSSSPSQTSAS
jgi:dynein heavy chain, axonemal